jgi:transcriptional regulator with XRE-family HTH domain
VTTYPVTALIRTLRRSADLSQRQLAERCGLPQQAIATMESKPELARVQRFDQIVRALGFHLVIVDDEGAVLVPDAEVSIRDRGGRRYPAHLDVRDATDGWWGSMWPMFIGRRPAYTFDRNRRERDRLRAHLRVVPDLAEEDQRA